MATRSANLPIIRTAGGAERDPVAYGRRQQALRIGLGIGVPVALLLLWQVSAVQGWINRFDYPAPTDIVAKTREVFQDNPSGNMWLDVSASGRRLLLGYLWGSLFGLAAGVAMGMSRYLRYAFEPMTNALYTVPKLALIGVFLIIFGFDDTPIVALIAVTVFFFVWIQTLAAVLSVSDNLREAAKSFGAKRRHMFRHVLLPASLPGIFVGLRLAAGVAVLTVIGVELVFTPGNPPRGVGYRINNARQILDPPQAYVGLFVAAIMGVLFTVAVKYVGRLLMPWAPSDNSVS